ncbi:SPOR domain-containing protein [Pseudodesulfovibrio portus]|uniref:SPOR domain-containing protein n=1 Tax=Pseudodesulfovibrio portus TaxID=231439 RepID=A0ABN6RYL1_9BACT|nr:SPOR domain-containing protein [Pseudodesulfovibrio portus]BDQ34536.1 hypothetical protein JCM14722_20780 [Pseudodesulfovibrio portus]
MNKKIFLLIVLVAAVLALSGCFRKSIDSGQPVKRPASQDEPGPAKEPGIISETYTVGGEEPPVIEETHEVGADRPEVIDESFDVKPAENDGPIEVEAAVEETDRPDVGGDDLAEEALPAPEAAQEPAAQPETAVVDPEAKAAFEPVADPEDEQVMAMEPAETDPEPPSTAMPVIVETGPYYVQVGAFSDLENANKVLAGLLADGYKGSMLEKTDNGMYRVHAGAFENTDDAAVALEDLKTAFPNGFVLKVE